jgi:hypothetical protein
LLWAEESAHVIDDWWISPHGNGEILDWLQKLASDVEADRFPQNYQVAPQQGPGSEYVVDSPIFGVCAVVEIFEDQVELIAILTEHPSEDDYPIP